MNPMVLVKLLAPIAYGVGGALLNIATRMAGEAFLGRMIYLAAKGRADRNRAKADAAVIRALSTKDPTDDEIARARQADAQKWQSIVAAMKAPLGID